jgi:adenine-specific DNA-methyltransferase
MFKSSLSIGSKYTNNCLFHGDNLNVLKSLGKRFANKVKVIYIDPPYNTGQVFDHYNDELTHSAWLLMMKERLIVMAPLLREDGSIWISIDENEVHYLKVLCDEIFGRKNFISTIIWEKKYSPSNDTKYISNTHDYILVYAKQKSKWRANLLPRTDEVNKRYKNPDNDIRGVWTSSDLTVKTPSPNYIYEITTPSGRKCLPAKSRSWAIPKSAFLKLKDENKIWFGKNGESMPRLKRFLTQVQDGIVTKSIWLRDEVGDNQEAKKEVKKINNDQVFTTPKPERLLEKIIRLATNEGDWVLDAFAGSGTTGAVAHKLKRKWVMIEINGSCEGHCLPRMKGIIMGRDNIGISKETKISGGGFKYFQT